MPKPGSLADIIGASSPKDSGAVTDDEADESMASDDFKSAAVDAFPDMADQPDRIAAFMQAIMACMEMHGDADSADSGDY